MGEQLLAARNALIGTTNILLIRLPEGWRLIEGYGAPEIDRWTEYREARWMSQGHAVYRLIQPHPGDRGLVRCEVELSVLASPLGGPAPAAAARHGLAETLGSEVCMVGGHEGFCLHGTVRRGLLPRRTVPALVLEWSCTQTGRSLRVMLNGIPRREALSSARAEDLETLARGLTEMLRCH
jgi:hypothetical protein